MKVLTLLEAVTDALRTEMASDRSVVVFGEDVGLEGGVFRATTGLQRDFGEERCFDTPIAESGIVGAAVGMAVAGLRPVVEIQFSGFAFPAFNQIASHVSRIRNRTRGALTAPLVIRMPYGGGIRAPEHHSESLEALFGHIPGLKVVIPSTPHDAKGLLIAAIRDPDPVMYLEPARAYRAVRQEVPEEAYTVEIGKAKIEAEGDELTLVSYGAQMIEARQARAVLAAEGRSVELIDLRTIYPFDARHRGGIRAEDRPVPRGPRRPAELRRGLGAGRHRNGTGVRRPGSSPRALDRARHHLPDAARGAALPHHRGARARGSAKGARL